jgi:hypothetical protein
VFLLKMPICRWRTHFADDVVEFRELEERQKANPSNGGLSSWDREKNINLNTRTDVNIIFYND